MIDILSTSGELLQRRRVSIRVEPDVDLDRLEARGRAVEEVGAGEVHPAPDVDLRVLIAMPRVVSAPTHAAVRQLPTADSR